MSSQITTAFTQQYSNNVKLLAQEKGSQLRNTVTVESVVGKNAFFDQVGVATAVKRTTRHADTLQVDTPSSRRRVSLVDGLKNQVYVKLVKLLETLFNKDNQQRRITSSVSER